jgi:uncharacterized protein
VTTSVVLAVRVTPRSGRSDVEGVDDEGVLHVRVTAPPVDGAANAAVLRLVARALGLPKGAVQLESGAAGRHKRLRVEGADRAAITDRWPGIRLGS